MLANTDELGEDGSEKSAAELTVKTLDKFGTILDKMNAREESIDARIAKLEQALAALQASEAQVRLLAALAV